MGLPEPNLAEAILVAAVPVAIGVMEIQATLAAIAEAEIVVVATVVVATVVEMVGVAAQAAEEDVAAVTKYIR